MVNIASTHGLVGAPERSTYGIAKAASIQMTRMLAVEWGVHGIRVNAVAPGRRRLHRRRARKRIADPKYMQAMLDRIPLHRLATAEEVAAAVSYLASPQAASVTGQVAGLGRRLDCSVKRAFLTSRAAPDLRAAMAARASAIPLAGALIASCSGGRGAAVAAHHAHGGLRGFRRRQLSDCRSWRSALGRRAPGQLRPANRHRSRSQSSAPPRQCGQHPGRADRGGRNHMLGAREQLEIRPLGGVGHQLDHELPVETQVHDAAKFGSLSRSSGRTRP